jgi:hypothetical protein
MKGSRNEHTKQSKEPAINNNRPRPENKDDLDARKNLEINDVPAGHNRKEDMHKGREAKNEHNDKRGTRQKK